MSNEPAWRAAQSPTAYRSRWWKVGGLAAGLAACLVAVSYTALWLRPPGTARLIILEAPYDTNLTVPPNATGAAAGRDLVSYVNTVNPRSRLRTGDPVKLTRGGTLLPELDTLKERNAIVFVAAHGGRDTEGAFLFPDDTTPDPAHRVRIKAVIDRLAKLPAQTNKVLILDATQPANYADLGLLHNDFADALEQLDGAIAAVPNLVVLSSSGVDQRSWTCPEWGRTSFAHYLLEGLDGSADADRNQRLTVWELFEHMTPRVHDWARDNRAALQTPVLLPKADGEARAKAITLASVDRAVAKPAVAPTPFVPPDELQQQWDEYRKLTLANPSPIAYAPHIWREYEAWVLRYESLLLNGTPEAAEGARAKAADAKRRMEALRKLPVSPQTLSLPFALGGLDHPHELPPAILDGIARLAATPAADRGKAWAGLRNLPGIEPEAARLLWCEGLVKWVATDPAARLAAAPPLIALVTEGMSVRPSEIHLLAMYAEHAPAFAKTDALGPLLGTLLELRTSAGVILSRPGKDVFGSLTALPWVRPEIDRGDASRRSAEDLAFASATSYWTRSQAAADQANESYRSPISSNIASAVRRWHQTAAILPGLTPWIAAPLPGDRTASRQEREFQVRMIQELWGTTQSFAHGLANGPSSDERRRFVEIRSLSNADGAFHSLDPILADLAEQHALLMESKPEFGATRDTRGDLVQWWQRAHAFLATPILGETSLEDRTKLGVELRRASRHLLVTGTTAAEPLKEVAGETTREQAFESARWLGLIQLSRTELRWSPERRQQELFTELEFELNNFPLRADSRQILAKVGDQIGRALNALPPLGDNPTLAQLYEADRRVRLMPAAATVPLGPGPCDALRRALTGQVLLAQAERTYVDHWYGGNRPYYRVAVEHLLDDARKITGKKLGDAETVWAKRLAKEAPFPLPPAVGQRLWLTDEPNLTVTYSLQRSTDDPAGPGFAVFWQESPFREPLKTPISREVRETGLPMSAAPPEPVTVTLSPPAGAKPKAPTVITGNGGLQAFFRGRFADTNSVVNYYPVPDRASVVLPTPVGATMAVRADPALQAKYGSATGSVAFVVDCSGSMRPPKDAAFGDNGRYAVAVETLEKLLRGIPAGTSVTVWSFGSRTPGSTSADETIREQLPPTVWARDNTNTINTVLSTLRGLEPWEESSIMRALLRARQGLVGAPGPFKAVVLLSDAVDNRWGQDAAFNPRKDGIKDALKTRFTDTGVRIGIVAIPVTDKDEAGAQQQFKAVETLAPAGKFVPPPEAESLLAWLRSGLNPRIRFSVTPAQTDSPAQPFDMAAGDDSADTWYAGRLPSGTYTMTLNAGREYRFPLEFRRGDRLLLRLLEERGQVKAERVWYAAEAPAVARSNADRTGGMLALLQNQALDGNALRLLATLEDRPPLLSFVNSPEHIGDAWFELTPTTPKVDPFALRFTAEPGYPAPSWSLDAAGWPTLPDGKTAAAHTLEAWWSPNPALPVLRWEVPFGANPLDLPPTRLPVNDNVVSLDSIRLEEHAVPMAGDQIATKKCLAVRFTHAPNKPVWARLVGLTPAGSEVRIFRAADKVTCLFWWPGETPSVDAIRKELKGLEIVSLKDFQAEATAAGRHVKLTDAPPPTPASARPQPPADTR